MQKYSLFVSALAVGLLTLTASPASAAEQTAPPVRGAAVIDNGRPAEGSEVRRKSKRKHRSKRNKQKRDRYDRHDRRDRHDRKRHRAPESRRWFVEHANAGDVYIDDMYMRIAEDGTWKFAAEFDPEYYGHNCVQITWHFYETRGCRRYHLFSIDVEVDIHDREYRELKGYFDRYDFDDVDYAHFEARLN